MNEDHAAQPPIAATLGAEDSVRFARQTMLVEVGPVGQARVLAASAAVGGEGRFAQVAERYALRAGFAATTKSDVDRDLLAPVALVRSEGARDVLAGARAALAEFRRIAVGGATRGGPSGSEPR